MKHAGADALDQLQDLLVQLRELPALRERSRGVFYFKSKPFLHFHSDPAGLFADLRQHDEFQRYPMNTPGEQKLLLQLVARQVA